MAGSTARTVDAYLAELPPERRAIVSTVRDLVNRHLPPGYSEAMGWGMICWGVPLSRYPDTYNGQALCYAALAAQKNAYSLHLMSVYAESTEEDSLRRAYEKAGKTLDMGKCCLRFKSLDGLLLDEVARIVAATSVEDYIAHYERSRAETRKVPRRKAAAGATAHRKRTSVKKGATKKAAATTGAAAKKSGAKRTSGKKAVAQKTAVAKNRSRASA